MNTSQIRALRIGIPLAIIALLFPPCYYFPDPPSLPFYLGCRFLLDNPDNLPGLTIDFNRLALELLIVGLITFGAYLSAKPRP